MQIDRRQFFKLSAATLVLTFAVFFLIELVGKLTIHPLHYTMLGTQSSADIHALSSVKGGAPRGTL